MRALEREVVDAVYAAIEPLLPEHPAASEVRRTTLVAATWTASAEVPVATPDGLTGVDKSSWPRGGGRSSQEDRSARQLVAISVW